jgi:hypothetical protein
MRGKWLIIPGLVLLAVLVSFAVSLVRSQGGRTGNAVKRAAAPKTAPNAAPSEVSLPVRIQAQQTVWVKSQITGTIEEFFVDVGQEVYEGQVLAKISNKSIENAQESASAAMVNARARVSAAEAAVVAARLEASRARADAQRSHAEMERTDKIWRRQKMLLAEGATPRLIYEKSEKEALSAKGEFEGLDTLARHVEERVEGLNAGLDNAKRVLEDKSAQLDSTQEQLKAAEVVCPVSCIVVARKGEAGPVENERVRFGIKHLVGDGIPVLGAPGGVRRILDAAADLHPQSPIAGGDLRRAHAAYARTGGPVLHGRGSSRPLLLDETWHARGLCRVAPGGSAACTQPYRREPGRVPEARRQGRAHHRPATVPASGRSRR